MKIIKFVALMSMPLVVGCAPDLIVKDLNVTWDAVNKTATAEIANIGNQTTGAP